MRARLGRWLGPAIVATLVAIAAAFSVVYEQRGWDVVLEDDFSNADTGVAAVEEDRTHAFRYVDGEYEITIAEKESGWSSFTSMESSAHELRIDVDARLLHGTRTTEDYYGVACGIGDDSGYVFGIYPDGYYFIARDPDGERPWAELAFGSARNVVNHGASVNRIRAECVGREGKPTLLRLSVNDRTIAEAIGSLSTFDSVWLLSSSSSIVPSRARFDNLVVSRK
jgi:hypothetical protein